MIIEHLVEELGKEFFEIGLVLLALYYIALTVAQYKLFIKAGEKGWKALIPFYSLFVSHHLIGMKHFWFILDMIFWALEVLLEVFKFAPLWLEETILTLAVLFAIISEIIHIMKVCYCYTKSELFGIGLFVIPPLFSLILAFGKSEYNPPRSHREKKEQQNAER